MASTPANSPCPPTHLVGRRRPCRRASSLYQGCEAMSSACLHSCTLLCAARKVCGAGHEGREKRGRLTRLPPLRRHRRRQGAATRAHSTIWHMSRTICSAYSLQPTQMEDWWDAQQPRSPPSSQQPTSAAQPAAATAPLHSPLSTNQDGLSSASSLAC